MGTVYARGQVLWIGYKVDGQWVYQGTDYRVGQEKQARAAVEAIEAALAKGEPAPDGGVPSVAAFAERWAKARITEGLSNAARELGRIEKYVARSTLGPMRLDQVERRHVREWLAWLKAQTWQRELMVKGGGTRLSGSVEKLAPRTIRSTHGILRSVFESAVERFIDVNPAKLKRNELPKKRDKNPAWRHTAVFTRGEVEQLISDERIPFVRRVTYALGFLGGLRAGEVSALRWRHLDADRGPLGCLHVVASYNKDLKREQPPKSGYPREVPVHPVLASLLAKLRLQHGGKPDDLVVPSRLGKYRTDRTIRDGMEVDFPLLELRWRRFHDARRTFTSLARAGGADKDVVRWSSHGPENEQMVDVYTSLPWPVLCDSVMKIKVGLLGAEVKTLRASGGGGSGLGEDVPTAVLQRGENTMHTSESTTSSTVRPEGFEPPSIGARRSPPRAVTGGSQRTKPGNRPLGSEERRSVVSQLRAISERLAAGADPGDLALELDAVAHFLRRR